MKDKILTHQQEIEIHNMDLWVLSTPETEQFALLMQFLWEAQNT